jgi:hypothetical protein
MTITRQSIIDQYRDHIASGQRTRLPKDELWEMIHGFINHLATLKTKSSIKAFCRSEIALLEEGYPKATVGKVYIPKYRAAIRDAIDHGSLPITKNTSRQYSYTKRNTGESGVSIDHLALDYLKYDQETYEQFAPFAPERSTATTSPHDIIDDHPSIDHNPPPTPETNPPLSIDNDQFAALQQEITQLWAHINTPPTPPTNELTVALDRITALESRNKSLEQDLSIALRSNLAYQRQLEKLSELLQKPPPHSKKRTPPATKITAAIDAIMVWNSQNDQKFVISQTLLLKATGCNLPAIKRVLEEQADSIEQHHAQFGILPRHQSKKLHLILDFLDLQKV